MKRVHLNISGDVQGVGFRAWAVGQAQELEITGWVKNREDGTVEVVAEGSQENLEKLIKECHRGPVLSRVKIITVKWSKATNESVSFEVVY